MAFCTLDDSILKSELYNLQQERLMKVLEYIVCVSSCVGNDLCITLHIMRIAHLIMSYTDMYGTKNLLHKSFKVMLQSLKM